MEFNHRGPEDTEKNSSALSKSLWRETDLADQLRQRLYVAVHEVMRATLRIEHGCRSGVDAKACLLYTSPSPRDRG